ncbi:unnamed protein product [Closterium sp. NIES-54]
MHSSMEEDPARNSSRDTVRDIPGNDDDVVEVTNAVESNLTGLRILGLAVAIRGNQQLVVPLTVCQALSGPDAEKWRAAMAAEVAALQRRGTWKLAPHLWQQYLHTVLLELGFQQLPHNQGMYRPESRGSFILLVAYVDDLLYTGDNVELLDCFEHDIKEKLKVTIDHNITQFLGLNVTQTADTIHLSAAKYAKTLAKKFGISRVGVTTPFRIPPPNHELDTTSLSPADHHLYQQQLGCLLFAAVTCRPDLSYTASQLAKYLRRPEGENMANLQCALQFFISTSYVCLSHKANLTASLQLTSYVDADHAGDGDNRRSRTGFIFKLEPAGAISWNSQELIALSSAEAEFITASAAVRKGLYLTELLQETKTAMNGSFKLLCDNQSVIKIANKPSFVNRTKPTALRYFFVKDEIDKGKVQFTYCPTGEMVADFLTKKLPRQKF